MLFRSILQQQNKKQVNVAMRFELSLVAAVSMGADRGALTCMAHDGNKVANDLLARSDLQAASEALAGMKSQLSETDVRIERLEGEIQALRGNGASAASRGNSEAILQEVRSLRSILN